MIGEQIADPIGSASGCASRQGAGQGRTQALQIYELWSGNGAASSAGADARALRRCTEGLSRPALGRGFGSSGNAWTYAQMMVRRPSWRACRMMRDKSLPENWDGALSTS
jgi:hypothetical protein